MPRTPVVARAPALEQQQVVDKPGTAPPLSPVQLAEPAICRLCWGEAEEDDDPLLSPCNCSGSLQHIHHKCLSDWQRTLRAQGQGRRAHICELCKTPYRLQPDSRSVQQGRSRRQVHRRVLTAVSNSLYDAVYRTSWPSLAVQMWHGYVMTHGAVQVGAAACPQTSRRVQVPDAASCWRQATARLAQPRALQGPVV